ncbi:hypothetical protein FGB62_110g112 [Gracilaria domingensis]|nr:hypothetical protein FGB62_110g112 [Gracilaria domingensis]
MVAEHALHSTCYKRTGPVLAFSLTFRPMATEPIVGISGEAFQKSAEKGQAELKELLLDYYATASRVNSSAAYEKISKAAILALSPISKTE